MRFNIFDHQFKLIKHKKSNNIKTSGLKFFKFFEHH